jgi:VWFA-related protein
MRYRNPTLLLLVLPLTAIVFVALLLSTDNSVTSQTRDKKVDQNSPPPQKQNSNEASSTSTPPPGAEVVKVDIDLVKIDALVLQKNTARIVGGLKKEDFAIYEDGARQEITHFSQDSLPLSVLLVIDRGACVDPYRDEVHRAAREAIDRLKPVDEIAVMSYHTTTTMVQQFTRNRILIENALNSIEPQRKVAGHCLNRLFSYAADYMNFASNPAGRRVVIVISALTRAFDCPDAPPGKSAAMAIYESGTVVCAIIPKVRGQGVENSIVTMMTHLTKVGAVNYMDIQTLADETGGEVMSDKPEKLETTFQTLIDHLRSRYNLAFVSTNKTRDGTMRKLKLDVAPPVQKPPVKLVIKARRSYVAPRN